jgi:hypothetical protein
VSEFLARDTSVLRQKLLALFARLGCVDRKAPERVGLVARRVMATKRGACPSRENVSEFLARDTSRYTQWLESDIRLALADAEAAPILMEEIQERLGAD